MAEGGGLLNRYRVLKLYRGFESLSLRQRFHISFDCGRFVHLAGRDTNESGDRQGSGGLLRLRPFGPATPLPFGYARPCLGTHLPASTFLDSVSELSIRPRQ